MSRPLALSDSQLDQVWSVAKTIPQDLRVYLQRLAEMHRPARGRRFRDDAAGCRTVTYVTDRTPFCVLNWAKAEALSVHVGATRPASFFG
jgi:hypothetical protein